MPCAAWPDSWRRRPSTRISAAGATSSCWPRSMAGMRPRLGIAAALLRNPRLLLLDEPATGLDPAGMRDMRLLIRRLAEQGMTVVLSSHLLAEVEELCN